MSYPRTPPAEATTVLTHTAYGADSHYIEAEAYGSRYDIVVVYRPDHIAVGVPNFGVAARIGYGFEVNYVSEKLRMARPDAAAICHILGAYMAPGVYTRPPQPPAPAPDEHLEAFGETGWSL